MNDDHFPSVNIYGIKQKHTLVQQYYFKSGFCLFWFWSGDNENVVTEVCYGQTGFVLSTTKSGWGVRTRVCPKNENNNPTGKIHNTYRKFYRKKLKSFYTDIRPRERFFIF